MPANNRVWLYETDGAAPLRPTACERRPELSVPRREVWSTLRSSVDGQLVTEGEILDDEISSVTRLLPRDREPQSELEPHARILPTAASRNLRLAQSPGGSDIRAPQRQGASFWQLNGEVVRLDALATAEDLEQLAREIEEATKDDEQAAA